MAILHFLSHLAPLALLASSAGASPGPLSYSARSVTPLPEARLVVVPKAAAAGSCSQQWFNDTVKDIVAAINSPGLTITALNPKQVSAWGSYGGQTDDPDNTQFPRAIDLLPALCAVKFRVSETNDGLESHYDFGMFFPDDWKQGMITVGGESFGGGINWPIMGEGVHHGFTAVSTNNGHTGREFETAWAKENESAKQDWGYRAVHGSVVYGKQLTAKFYNTNFKSYYSGCSTGGRQGLRELMDHADSFDGLLIGAPAWDTVNISPWVSHLSKILSENGGAFTIEEITGLATEVIRQCDAQVGSDKVPDFIISDPVECYKKLNITKVFCVPGGQLNCIEEQRAKAVLPAFFESYSVPATVATPELVSPGFDAGSEWLWLVLFSNGSNFLDSFNLDYIRNFLNIDIPAARNYEDKFVKTSRDNTAGKASVPPFDLGAFKARQGKIIMYHGMADGVLPRQNTERWYQSVRDKDTSAASFFRYFEVPGMGHCFFNNPALPLVPWIFGGAGQASRLRQLSPPLGDGWTNIAIPSSPPTPDADALTALVNWVAGGSAPDEFLVGSLQIDHSLSPPRPWTRRICAYPKKPAMNGTELRDKNSWECRQ